ncbi:hypothetical protein JNO48_04495 [Clostridiales bacterium]|nr:hypothetical protein JNO48_04495 [Clostridiales bacterium]
MSLVMQIIQAVTATEREIDDQMAKLTSYNTKVDEVMRRVQAELGDSTTNYAQEMISQLQQTKEQVDDTLQKLQAAKDKLIQVRAI